MTTAYSGTSGPLRWYFRVPIVTCVVVLRDPYPPGLHGDSADLRRKHTIGISKPHGGTSGPLNMFLRWYFETPKYASSVVLRDPRITMMVVLRGTLWWYFEVPIVGLRGPLGWYFGVRWNQFWWYFEVPNAKIICAFAGILAYEQRVIVVLKYCCFPCF